MVLIVHWRLTPTRPSLAAGRWIPPPAHGVWAVGFRQGVPGDQRPWALQLDRDGRTGSRLPDNTLTPCRRGSASPHFMNARMAVGAV